MLRVPFTHTRTLTLCVSQCTDWATPSPCACADVFRSCRGYLSLRMIPNNKAPPGSLVTSPWLLFVEFETTRDANKALNLLTNYAVDLKKPDEARLRITFARPAKRRA